MKTLIIDTSVIIKWLNQDNENYTEKTDSILEEVREGKAELLIPELCKYEVGNVLLYGKKQNFQQANLSFKAFYSLPLTFITESEELSKQTYQLAYNYGITYYDAAFMSLAKMYDAILVTDNFKHQGKTKDITVISLEDY